MPKPTPLWKSQLDFFLEIQEIAHVFAPVTIMIGEGAVIIESKETK